MNWEAVGAIREIVGAMAVIASLVFVGIQLRHNTGALRMSSTNDVRNALIDNLVKLARDENLAQLMFKGIPDPSVLQGDGILSIYPSDPGRCS